MRQPSEEASRTPELRSLSTLDELLEVADDILIRRLGMDGVSFPIAENPTPGHGQ